MSRTLNLTTPHQRGEDVEAWRIFVARKFRSWNIHYPLAPGDQYDQATRAATATLMRAWGVRSAQEAMASGVTSWWRTKIRNDSRSLTERALFVARAPYRASLRRKYSAKGIAAPLAHVIEDSWGYHPPGHDGLDLICAEDAPLFAICDGTIVRADASGWWGKGAQASAGHPVSDGDGVIILRCGVNRGPFKKGLNFVYGHAEHATVKAGDRVKAGQVIGKAGFANAAHVHLCVNGRKDTLGVGDRDPRPFWDAVKPR